MRFPAYVLAFLVLLLASTAQAECRNGNCDRGLLGDTVVFAGRIVDDAVSEAYVLQRETRRAARKEVARVGYLIFGRRCRCDRQ